MMRLKPLLFSTLLAAGAVCAISSAGCNSGQPPAVKTDMVEGVVTLDGQPVPGATVTFLPVQDGAGASATGMTDASGKYTLTAVGAGIGAQAGAGTLPGEYRVGVLKDEIPDLAQIEQDPEGKAGGQGKEIKITHVIPQKFNDPRKSEIPNVTVKAGDNDIPIDLKSK